MIFKKQILLSALIGVLAPFHINALDISISIDQDIFAIDPISQEKVEEHKTNIERMMKRHRWMRVAFVAGAGVVIPCGIYLWLAGDKKISASSLQSPIDSGEGPPTRQEFEVLKKMVVAQGALLKTLVKKPKTGFLRKIFSCAKSIGKDLCKGAVASVCWALGAMLYEKLFYKEGVAWFFEKQTSI